MSVAFWAGWLMGWISAAVILCDSRKANQNPNPGKRDDT